jgi:transcriptional regulator with XRE-family HTH domain
MSDFGARLKEERKRLKLSVQALAEQIDVHQNTVYNYEKGARMPDVDFLLGAAAAGLDLYFVLTGERSAGSLTEEEASMLAAFRIANGALRTAALAVLTSGVAPVTTQQVFHGQVGQNLKVDSPGNHFTVNMGGGKKPKR